MPRVPLRPVQATSVAALAAAVLSFPFLATGAAQAASVSTWEKVAQCESSGNWAANTGNGYYGGLQFSLSTWNAYGGTAYATYPYQATEDQQIMVGEKVLAAQGQNAWPTCGPAAGLGSDTASPFPSSSPTSTAPMTNLTGATLAGSHRGLLAMETATGDLYYYPGNGNGTLGARTRIGTGWDTMNHLTAGDFSGDGKDDVIAVQTSTGNLYLYPGTGTLPGALGSRVQIGSGWGGM
ncbi:transglycosylase family protein, partial [Streptacidiphilus monticola]